MILLQQTIALTPEPTNFWPLIIFIVVGGLIAAYASDKHDTRRNPNR